VTAASLRQRAWVMKRLKNLPTGALGLYTYYERLHQGLSQIMAGSRKFALEHITRGRSCSADTRGGENQRYRLHHGFG